MDGGPWLHALPILPTTDLDAAAEFYLAAGLTVERYDAGYAFVSYGGHEVLHLAVVPELDPAANFTASYLHVPDVDAVHDQLRAAGLPVTSVRDEPWGMREFSLVDPSGNRLRVGCADADPDAGDR